MHPPDDDDDLLLAAGVRRPRRGVWLALAFGVVVAGGVIAALSVGDTPAPTSRSNVRDGDIATSSPPVDGGATADAAVAGVTADAAAGWSHAGRGKQFSFTVTAPSPLRRGTRNTLTFAFSDMQGQLADAAALEIQYFKDHRTVYEMTHELDEQDRFDVDVELRVAGKHHVRLRLLHDGRVVDQAQFDLVVP